MVEKAGGRLRSFCGRGFIIQDGRFSCGIRDKVKIAQTQLQLMRGSRRDADARQQDEETIRIWVAEIRDAAYDLEDVTDFYFHMQK
ncbi:hypothetical protein ACFX2I_027662 [Malus domestica]